MFSQVEGEKRKEEQRKFGVFFDDDYDYLQHLREASQPAELVSAPRPSRDSRPVGSGNEDEQDQEKVLTVPVSLVSV